MEQTRPVLILNPGDDRAFADLAEQLVSEGRLTTDALQTALRPHFPATVVRPRELSHEVGTVWYVYREGRWVPPVDETRREAGDPRERSRPRPRRPRVGRSHPTARPAHRADRAGEGRARDGRSGASRPVR